MAKDSKNFNLIDSHCHLDFEELYSDLDQVLYRANNQGVSEIITICTTLTNIDKIEKITRKYKYIWHTAGIHPHEASRDPFATNIEKLLIVCSNKKCVGIGEAGLDYYYDFSPKKDQLKCFEMQINASQYIDKPIVIHSRDADKDMEDIIVSNYKLSKFRGVLHCFTGSKELARAALDIGFYISFSGILTFKNSTLLQEIASYIPSDRFLIETDSPYLSPVPFRGKTNEPKNTFYIAEYISKLRGGSFNAIAQQSRDNTLKLFNNLRTNL
tara:strand:- start:37 stop:846 length:810 start_codon:yes stop_codon:yes gene_type:complete